MTFDDILDAEIIFADEPEESADEVALGDVGLSAEELKMVENTVVVEEPGEHTLPHAIFNGITLSEFRGVVGMRTEAKPYYIMRDGQKQLAMRTYFGNFDFVLSGYDIENAPDEAREVQVYCRFHLDPPSYEAMNTFNKSLSSSGLYVESGELTMQTLILLTGGVSVINLVTQVEAFL